MSCLIRNSYLHYQKSIKKKKKNTKKKNSIWDRFTTHIFRPSKCFLVTVMNANNVCMLTDPAFYYNVVLIVRVWGCFFFLLHFSPFFSSVLFGMFYVTVVISVHNFILDGFRSVRFFFLFRFFLHDFILIQDSLTPNECTLCDVRSAYLLVLQSSEIKIT